MNILFQLFIIIYMYFDARLTRISSSTCAWKYTSSAN